MTQPSYIEVHANDGVSDPLTLIVNGERVHGTLAEGVAVRLADDGWNVPLLARIVHEGETPDANTIETWIVDELDR